MASSTPAGDAAAEITANQHTIDLYNHHYSVEGVATSGYAYNLMNLGSRNIDFSQPWWDQEYVNTYTVKNSAGQNTLYSVVGDFALTTFDCTHALIYNKSVYNNTAAISDIDVYQLVRDKKWTMDTFALMVKAAAMDIDNDGVVDSRNGDVAGWIRTGHATHGLHTASGLSIMTNTNGVLSFEVNKNTEAWINVIEKSMEMWAMPEGQTLSYSVVPETIAGGYTLFASEILGAVIPNFADLETEIGVLPYPLHSEDQENYAHWVDNHVYSYSIPTSCDNPDAVADFLTVYAYASRYIVRPVYMDVYAYEYCSGEEDYEMLEIIFGSKTYDPGYLAAAPNLEADLSSMITNNKTNVALFAAKKAASANAWIDRFIAGIDDNAC